MPGEHHEQIIVSSERIVDRLTVGPDRDVHPVVRVQEIMRRHDTQPIGVDVLQKIVGPGQFRVADPRVIERRAIGQVDRNELDAVRFE